MDPTVVHLLAGCQARHPAWRRRAIAARSPTDIDCTPEAKRMRSGGGLQAIRYSLRKARESGSVLTFYRRMRARNTCKTCALGMSGMKNEAGGSLEVCKKSFQAQAADMQPPIAEEFFRGHGLDELLRLDHKQLEDAGRIGFPLLLEPGAGRVQRIDWKRALDIAATALRETPPQQAMFYMSGRSSNEAAFLLQSFARVYGTNNVNNCSYYCHQASGVGLSLALGTGTATVTLEDCEQADFVMLIGANPASNHPRLVTRLVDVRRRGGHVVTVNPLREIGLVRFRIPSRPLSLAFGSQVTDVYVQPHVGGDVAFLKGVAKAVVERGGADRAFLDAHTRGWPAVEADLRAASWQDLERAGGVARGEMERVADFYRRSERALFMWAMGVTHHTNGVDNVLAIANLALLRGMAGKPGAGLLPIRGHSNVQGVGSVGVTPALKAAFARAMEEAYGVPLPPEPGLDTYNGIVAMSEGRIRTAVYLGGNLFSANPDSEFAARAMQRVETAIYISTKLNPGHFHGRGVRTLILPARTRDEESQATTQESMFNYVRLSTGGAPPASPEMRSEVDIVASIAARVLPAGPVDWSRLQGHRELRREIARVVPGYAAVSDIDATRRDFTIAGRVRHSPEFATEDGRACLHVTPVPALTLAPGELRLATIRSEGQFNTVVYDYEDVYRGADGRDVVFMNAADAHTRGLHAGDRVVLVSETGRYGPVRVLLTDIRAGNLAAYYPEANVLVPRRIDPRSVTPAFKSVAVRVEPAGAGAAMPVAIAASST
jgi:molybdopterin-dependent oxidoreductase alpha subunit